MNDVENLLREARLASVAPAPPTDAARRALHGVRRRRQLQAGAVGGVTVAVVGGGALLASTRPDGASGQPVGGAPAPVVTSPAPVTTSAEVTRMPASTPECLAVKAHLAQLSSPAGYSRTDSIQPAQLVWQRGWLRADKAHASLEVTAFCTDPLGPSAPSAATSETVEPVTVQDHKALLTTDFGGSFARITWSPNASTEVSVSANAFQPNSWGRTAVTELRAARLTNAQLLAFAQTVPTS